MNLSFEQFPKQLNFQPKKLVIFLHGYGSNAQDLISLAPEIQGHFDNIVFVSPNAPFSFEGRANNAYQWYSLVDRRDEVLLKGFYEALPILENFIKEQLQKFNLNYSDLILAGFSQGGMIALQSSIVRSKPVQCAISFSGYIINHKNFNDEIKSRPPIFMTHGDQDSIVPLKAYKGSLQLLTDSGLSVDSYLAKGLGHGIDFNCIDKTIKFLQNLIRLQK